MHPFLALLIASCLAPVSCGHDPGVRTVSDLRPASWVPADPDPGDVWRGGYHVRAR